MEITCDTKTITHQFKSVSESWLAVWFIDKYIRKCAQMCPENVSQLFDDVSTVGKLQHAVSAVVYWRRSNKLHDLFSVVYSGKCNVSEHLYSSPLSAWSCVCWMTELPKTDGVLFLYFIALAFLYVARKLSNNGMFDTVKLLDILATIVGHVGLRTTQHCCSQYSSVLPLSKAADLMKVIATNSRSTVQLIRIELSKAYLCRAVKSTDSDSDSIYCLANVYLAVLYYATGQYQTAMDHCTLVMRSQDHSQCSSHVVQGELLPKIDRKVNAVLGLAVFYFHVKHAALNQQQHNEHVSVFTMELFAHYLHIICPSATNNRQTSLTSEVQRYRKYVANTPRLFTTDVLLYSSIQHCCFEETVERREWTTKQNEKNTLELVELLQQSAVEHLTACRRLEVKRFGSVVAIVGTDFEALYAYKCGDYQHCLQLSTQNVHTLFRDIHMTMTDVPIYSAFVQLLDNDIVSLTAFTLIANPEQRENNSNYVGITQWTLSLYLMAQCQLKLLHSLTSLAQTLDCIKIAHRKHPVTRPLDLLTLKLTERKVMTHITLICDDQ